MGRIFEIFNKIKRWAGFIFRHVMLVFFACMPATMIGVFLWAAWSKGMTMKMLGGTIMFAAVGIQLMAPVVIFIYLPIALAMWRFRTWSITFPIVGAVISMAACMLLFNGFKNLTKDMLSFFLLFGMPGALTGLFHYMLLYKTEALLPSMGRPVEQGKVSKWAVAATSCILLVVCAMVMFQSFAPKKMKESCFSDVTVTMGEHKLVVPRKYWPSKDERGRLQPSVKTYFFAGDDGKPENKLDRDCRMTELEDAKKIFFANMKLTDAASDPDGPVWYQKRHDIVSKAEKTDQPYVINPDNGKWIYTLPLDQTKAADGTPVYVECTPPEESTQLKQKIYKGIICYANYRHSSGLQVGYTMPHTEENIGKLVAADLAIQKQVQTMVDAGKSSDRKVDTEYLDSVPMEKHPMQSKCSNKITFSLNGHKMKADMDMFRDVSIKSHGIFNLAGPHHDCSIEDVGEVTEMGGDNRDDDFTLQAVSPAMLEHLKNPQPNTDPNKREFIGRVDNTFKGMEYEKLPLAKHPTLDGQPVIVRCFEMQKSCHVRYMHPLGFWVQYQRRVDVANPAEADLAVRAKIDEMLKAAE